MLGHKYHKLTTPFAARVKKLIAVPSNTEEEAADADLPLVIKLKGAGEPLEANTHGRLL